MFHWHSDSTGWVLATAGVTNKLWTNFIPDLTLSNVVLGLSAFWIILQIIHKIKNWNYRGD